jgi:hypothetical protein
VTQPIAPFPFGLTIQIERGTRSEHGDVNYTDSHTIDGCAWAPRESTEVNDNRTTVIVGLTLYGPYGADIRHDDRVVLPDVPERGLTRKQRTWRVDGEVGDWRSPFTGWEPGFEVALERVS